MILGSIGNAVESLIDNKLRDKVKPIPGSMVYCDLAHAVEHTGIYVGNNQIVHLDGSGVIESVSPEQFLARLKGLNSIAVKSIYVSSHSAQAVGCSQVADRAISMIGKTRDYFVLNDNCHQFSAGCLTGQFENSDNFLWTLKRTAAETIGATEWRVWDLQQTKDNGMGFKDNVIKGLHKTAAVSAGFIDRVTDSKATKFAINKVISDYGELKSLSIDAKEGLVELALHLHGDAESIALTVTDYAIVERDDEHTFVVKSGKSNRQWLDVVITKHVIGVSFEVPEVVVPYLKAFLD